MVNLLPPNAPSPRLCLVKKSADHQEYGFNLHAERGKGQFVGVVDDNSPAEKAGLKSGDRIFAVNGDSIVGASHKEVVYKIKSNPMQCELLVISEEGAQWYQEHEIPINSQLPNIIQTCQEPIYAEVPSNSSSTARWRTNTSPVVVSKMRTKLRPVDNSVTKPAFSTVSLNETSQNHDFDSSTPMTPTPIKNGYLHRPIKNNSTAHNSVNSAAKPMVPRPRLCTLVKQGPVHEFGFNLHAERGKGHFIGSVDKDGIADRAGLETGQRIVGVNGHLIYPNTAHKEVVALIKRDPLAAELLVASEEIDRWHTETGTPFSYDHVIIFEADNRPRVPSSASSNQQHHHSSAMSAHHHGSDSRSATKSNGSSVVGVQRRENIVGHPERLQTTYMVDSTQDFEGDTFDYSAGNRVLEQTTTPLGTPDDLLEKVFSRVKPPAVHATNLHDDGHYAANYQNVEESYVNDQKSVASNKEILTTRNGHSRQSSSGQSNKHVIASSAPAPVSHNQQYVNGSGNSVKSVPLVVSPYSEKKSTGSALVGVREFPSPVSTDSQSVTSTGSVIKDENRDIFKLSARDARQLMKGKKKDPRMENMSLQEKYNVIANL